MAHNPPQVPAWPSSANMAVQGTADVPTAERAASSARLLREYARRCRRALRRILRIKSPSTQQSARPPSLQSSSSWHTPPSPPASSRHTPSPPPPPGQTPTNPLQDLPSTSRPPSPTRSPPIPLAAPHSPTTEPPLATGRMPTQQPFNFGVLDQAIMSSDKMLNLNVPGSSAPGHDDELDTVVQSPPMSSPAQAAAMGTTTGAPLPPNSPMAETMASSEAMPSPMVASSPVPSPTATSLTPPAFLSTQVVPESATLPASGQPSFKPAEGSAQATSKDTGGVNSMRHSHHSSRPARNVSVPIDKLEKYYVPNATYERQPLDHRCMRGTCVQVLEEAKHLITTREGSHVVWISGMAGTGKTSIALSLCDVLAEEPTVLLGGTFFFSRAGSSIKRNIARYVVPTLATRLVCEEPACKATLVAELEKDPDFIVRSIEQQIDNLLVKPLNSLGFFHRQVIFVIDGLDQCRDERQLRELVQCLAVFKCRVPVKFLVTARPDPRTRKIRIHRTGLQPRIELYSMDLVMVTADIQHYIHTAFANSPAVPEWYSDRDPAELAEKAAGVFAFAAVTVKHVLSAKNAFLRAKRVREVKELNEKGLMGLNEMYSLMLTRAMDLSSNRERVQRIIAAIIASRMPQQVKTLAELLELSPFEVRESLIDLQAVVSVPEADDTGELHVQHTTFAEFFLKSISESASVSESFGHDVLARGCLKRLAADDLCFNVSKAKSAYAANPDTEPDIARSLRYASIAWPFHVYNASMPSAHDSQIYSVLRCKLLFWLELTSRIVEVDHWSELLLRVAASKAQSPALSQFLGDAITFVETFRDAIEFNSAHIYISALPFAPKDSLVYQIFYPLFRGLVNVETFGVDPQGDCKITAAAVSPDGEVVVIASNDGSVRMSKLGAPREMDTMTLDHELEGEVCSVAISPDGQLIATGSSDHVVRTWDVAKAELAVPPQRGHLGGIRAIAFSPDSTHLTSGSEDKTLRLWKVRTVSETVSGWMRQKVVQFLGFVWTAEKTGLAVCSLAYSLDGSLIAVGYSGGVIQVIHASTGLQMRSFTADRDGNDLKSLIFPSKEQLIWVTSGQNILGVDITKQSVVLTAAGHTATVNMLAHSTDGRFIVSCADDATIRVWDAKTAKPYGHALRDHNGPVVSVRVSQDGRSLFSVGSDGTARAWDFAQVTSPENQHRQSFLARLKTNDYQEGWIVDSSPSKRRLIWVPAQYRNCIEISHESRVVTAHWKRAALTCKHDDLYYGENWVKCWHGSK